MRISKVFNLRHLDGLLGNMSGNAVEESVEFFALGLPPFDPPRIRGSFLAIFSDRFLENNFDAIKWWSPVDTGSLASRIYVDIPDEDIAACRLRVDSLKIIRSLFLSLDVWAQNAWERNRANSQMSEALLEKLPSTVVRKLSQYPARQIFNAELCVDMSKVIWDDVRASIWVPSDLRRSPVIQRLQSLHWVKMNNYDAKYGIEEAGKEAILLSRSL